MRPTPPIPALLSSVLKSGKIYNYTITSDGGSGTVTGSDKITAADQHITGINVSTLPDGTLTVSVTL